ncbi:MAG: 1,4-dihydroxy-2-naphthoate octaprenyltransferase [Candidatus Zixiibacteriota bacterium]
MKEGKFKDWLAAPRLPFLTASVVPVFFGTALGWQRTGEFNPFYFFLTLVGVCLAQMGANMANDYYDHKTTDDDINKNPTPFSGGSRVIQEGKIKAASILKASLLCYALGAIIALYLNSITPGNFVLILALVGFLSGFLYTATPAMLGYRGLGEPLLGLNFGTLTVIGAYFVQTHTFSWEVFWISWPISFLIVAVLYINQFPDYEPDKAVDKRHWVVRLGRKKATYGYYALIFGSYLWVIVTVIIGILTPFALIVLVTLPKALKASRILRTSYDKILELIPANAATIQVHLLIGLLLSLACVVGGLVLPG